MPLNSVTAFDPETLTMLKSVLEEACAEIFLDRFAHPNKEIRTLLALRIIEHAKAGERSPDRL